MDAEMLRDQALAAQRLLVGTKMGGPVRKTYQPEGVWEDRRHAGEQHARYYEQDKGEALYRRSVYTLMEAHGAARAMEILNATNRETSCVRRDRTNTPLQAFVTLNDPQFVEAARQLAEQVLLEAARRPDVQALDLRTPHSAASAHGERRQRWCRSSHTRLLAHYRAQGARPAFPVPKAKHVIYLHMVGGPAQMDLYDYKPEMQKWYDKDLPDSVRKGQRLTTMTSGQARFPIAPSKFKFAQHGNAACG
jgi:hypothetical protein